jgi:hypothetical protein
MRDYHRETVFLRQVLLYDDTSESQHLDQKLEQAQRDERCLNRAVWFMAILTALSLAVLCYLAFLNAGDFRNYPQFAVPFILKAFCALGLGSLICLVAFMGLRTLYRKKLEHHREECRRLAAKVMESRLGKGSA